MRFPHIYISQRPEFYPFASSREVGLLTPWLGRLCAPLCLQMILHRFYGRTLSSWELMTLLHRWYVFYDPVRGVFRSHPYYNSGQGGWLHYGLLQAAREFGLYAGIRPFSLQNGGIMTALESAWAEGYEVLLSIHKYYDKKEGGHVVYPVASRRGEVLVYDPKNKSGTPSWVPVSVIEKGLKGQHLILFTEKDTEWMRAQVPLRLIPMQISEVMMSADPLGDFLQTHKSDTLFLHVHDNERNILTVAQKMGLPGLTLRQNAERFVRGVIPGTHDPFRTYRLDPNRVWNGGLPAEVQARNKHLTQDECQRVTDIFTPFVSLVTDLLARYQRVITLHNNRLMDIQTYKKTCEFHGDNTQSPNTFFLFTDRDDWERCRDTGLLCFLLTDTSDSVGLDAVCARRGQSYICCEFGYHENVCAEQALRRIIAALDIRW